MQMFYSGYPVRQWDRIIQKVFSAQKLHTDAQTRFSLSIVCRKIPFVPEISGYSSSLDKVIDWQNS
jgi:hypothetical protein